jgi:hypothetical protein
MTSMAASSATVYSDDFATNPFASNWSKTNTDGNYDLQWTGNANPNSWSASLPVNANAHSVYSFSGGPRTMSTVNTTVPLGVTGWTEMTYSVDFQMGGTGGVDNNYIGVLVNRSGDNGYTAGIYTGGDGNILWSGDYGDTEWSGYNVAADTWYKFKTTVTKSGAAVVNRDDAGRPKLKIRKHDHHHGWFDSIVERHGESSPEWRSWEAFEDRRQQLWLPGLGVEQDELDEVAA